MTCCHSVLIASLRSFLPSSNDSLGTDYFALRKMVLMGNRGSDSSWCLSEAGYTESISFEQLESVVWHFKMCIVGAGLLTPL